VRGFSPRGKTRTGRLGEGGDADGEDGDRRRSSVHGCGASEARTREKTARGSSRGRGGGSTPIYQDRGAGENAPTTHSAWAAVAQAPGAGGCRAARGRRRRRQVGPRRQRLGKEARQRLLDGRRKLGWSGAGLAQMLGRVARKGGRLSWAAGRRWASGRKRAENKEGKGETDSFLFFFYTFPNPFLNSNFNSF